jgi:hypothetical protein
MMASKLIVTVTNPQLREQDLNINLYGLLEYVIHARNDTQTSVVSISQGLARRVIIHAT